MTGAVFGKYRVVEKVPESRSITSFTLAPEDGSVVEEFKPGQYITLRLPDHTIRTYTVSSSSKDITGYRISVKREAPTGELPPGKASNYLHDHLSRGAFIDVLAPRGDFWLNQVSSKPVLLLSGGVGVTPMISMLHALQDTSRDVCFIHACREAGEHAFKDEVDNICQINKKIKTVFFCKDALSESKSLADYRRDSIKASFFKELNCDLDSECYLCGPKAFMKSVYNALVEYGIPKSNIYYEFFGESTLLGGTERDLTIDQDAPECVIEFTKSGKTLQWAGFTGSLLEFCDSHGVTAASSCRLGVCGTCECRVIAGDITHFAEPLDPPQEGHAYLCISKPTSSKLILDI